MIYKGLAITRSETGSMKLSIVIPSYEPGDRILSTIDSVLDQKFTEYEIIIQDGSLTDSVNTLIQDKYPENGRILFFHETDNGVYDAMNRAVKKATGEYCIFMGAGDKLHDEKVLSDLEYAASAVGTDIIYGSWIEVNNGKEETVVRKLDWKYAVKFTPVSHQAVLAKTELLKAFPFDTSYEIAADQDWLLRMKKMKRTFFFLDRPISYYLLDGLSSNNNDKFVKEQKEIHGKYYPFWQTVRYTWRRMAGKDKR